MFYEIRLCLDFVHWHFSTSVVIHWTINRCLKTQKVLSVQCLSHVSIGWNQNNRVIGPACAPAHIKTCVSIVSSLFYLYDGMVMMSMHLCRCIAIKLVHSFTELGKVLSIRMGVYNLWVKPKLIFFIHVANFLLLNLSFFIWHTGEKRIHCAVHSEHRRDKTGTSDLQQDQ